MLKLLDGKDYPPNSKKGRNTIHNIVGPFESPMQFHFQYLQNLQIWKLVWPMKPSIWMLSKKRLAVLKHTALDILINVANSMKMRLCHLTPRGLASLTWTRTSFWKELLLALLKTMPRLCLQLLLLPQELCESLGSLREYLDGGGIAEQRCACLTCLYSIILVSLE